MINKEDKELLLDIQDEIRADTEMMEEVYIEIDEILEDSISYKDFSPQLKDLLEVKKRKETNLQAFIRELTELSKEYDIVVTGKIKIGKIKNIEYSVDESNNLIP